jgi:hypothetical protein
LKLDLLGVNYWNLLCRIIFGADLLGFEILVNSRLLVAILSKLLGGYALWDDVARLVGILLLLVWLDVIQVISSHDYILRVNFLILLILVIYFLFLHFLFVYTLNYLIVILYKHYTSLVYLRLPAFEELRLIAIWVGKELTLFITCIYTI